MINEFVLSNREAENLHAHRIAHPDPPLLVDAHTLRPRELARLDRLLTDAFIARVRAFLAEHRDELAIRGVDFDAPVAAISDHHMAFVIEAQSRWTVKLIRSSPVCAELALEFAAQIERLLTVMKQRICKTCTKNLHNVRRRRPQFGLESSYACRKHELTRLVAIAAKGSNELAVPSERVYLRAVDICEIVSESAKQTADL